jgi:hypothetical protein
MEPWYQRSSRLDVKGEDLLINSPCSVLNLLVQAFLVWLLDDTVWERSLMDVFLFYAEKWFTCF